MKIKILPMIITSLLFSFSVSAASYPNDPKFDCSVAETKLYIEQVTASVFAESPISTPDQFSKAYLDEMKRKAAAGDDDAQSCASIFSGEGLKDEWKNIVDSVRGFEMPVSYSSIDGPMLEALLQSLKDKATQAFTDALETIGGDVCKLISSDSIKGMLLDATNKKFGTGLRSLRLEAFANELTEEVLLNADDDILLLLSEDDLKDKISSEAKQEMKEVRTNLWKNF